MNLLFDRAAPSREHFCYKQSGAAAAFFGHVNAYREAGAFFAAKSDFVLTNKLANVLKADGSLKRGLAARLRRGVNHLRCSDAARSGHVPVARFDEVIVNEREDLVRRNPAAVAVDDAEAIGVAVGFEPGTAASVRDCLARP